MCWQTPNCIQTETVSFPSNNCLVWAECEAPSYPPPTSYGPAYNSYGGGKGGTVYKRRDAGSDDSVSGAPRDAGAAPADSASQVCVRVCVDVCTQVGAGVVLSLIPCYGAFCLGTVCLNCVAPRSCYSVWRVVGGTLLRQINLPFTPSPL